MIRLFAKLRRMNLNSRNFLRYMHYAIGEVILIIIRIMIALYLNEWSIRKDKEEAFEIALAQVNMDLQKELDWYEFKIASYKKQSSIAVQEYRDEQAPFNSAKMVGYLNSIALGQRDLLSETLLQRLNESITNGNQTLLVDQISTYYATWQNWNEVIETYQVPFLSDLIHEYKLPFISNYIIFYATPYQRPDYEFTEKELQNAHKLRADERYKTGVKSIIHRNLDLVARYQLKVEQIRETMDLIREYDPSIQITYDRIGILGSATTHGWDRTIFMDLKDPDKRIWRIRIKLDEGDIKFRDGDSWDNNWGDNFDQDGGLIANGFNIPVKPGTYEVELNMTDKTYSLNRITQ